MLLVASWATRLRRRIDEILALAYADRVEQMIRLPAFIIVGCVVCAGLIPGEFGSITSPRPEARLPPAEIESAAPESRKLANPLSSPAQRRPETASAANDADLPLRDVRLAGVVIGPDLRKAVFAVNGTSSRALSEGETLKGWRLESISPKEVVLSGPGGRLVLEPQPDANLVRSPPPVAVQAGQPQAPMAAVPGQPMAVTPTPIVVYNLSAGTPVQTQGYPYSPEYYPGYDANYPWGWDWGSPWGWGWPVGVSVGFGRCWNCGFRRGFFRPGFRRFGFGHSGFFHPGFFHPGFPRSGFVHARFGGGFGHGIGGGFHGGGRR